MGLQLWDKAVKSVYIWDKTVKTIYIGDQKVRSADISPFLNIILYYPFEKDSLDYSANWKHLDFKWNFTLEDNGYWKRVGRLSGRQYNTILNDFSLIEHQDFTISFWLRLLNDKDVFTLLAEVAGDYEADEYDSITVRSQWKYNNIKIVFEHKTTNYPLECWTVWYYYTFRRYKTSDGLFHYKYAINGNMVAEKVAEALPVGIKSGLGLFYGLYANISEFILAKWAVSDAKVQEYYNATKAKYGK